MKKTKFTRFLSLLLTLALVAAIVLTVVGCSDKNTPSTPSSSAPSSSHTDSSVSNELGQGKTKFTLNVTFKDGSEKTFTVNTDKTTVGEALMEVGLISGTVGDYGLMVERVDGETVTYAADKKYWAFYIGDKYATSGVDTTEIVPGETYSLKVE